MFNRKSKNRKRMPGANVIAAACGSALLLCGCNQTAPAAEAVIPHKTYQKLEYVTTVVQKGDMKPVLTLKLKAQLGTQIRYTVNLADAEVDEVYVSTGDKVVKGQLLVSFKSEKTKKEIENYRAELEEKQLMLDHYTRMSLFDLQEREYYEKERKEYPLYQQQEDEINKERDQESKRRKAADYSFTVQQLQSDVDLAALYLEEATARLEHCQIRAEEDGVISFMSQGLLSGYVQPGETLMNENCGENTYAAYTRDDYDFRIGDSFTAEDENASYKMTVTQTSGEDDGTRRIVFVPDATLLNPPEGEALTMTIEKTRLFDVVYVEKGAIATKGEQSFVYLVSENGFLDAREVETGEVVENMVVIKKGLNGNEKVAVIK